MSKPGVLNHDALLKRTRSPAILPTAACPDMPFNDVRDRSSSTCPASGRW